MAIETTSTLSNLAKTSYERTLLERLTASYLHCQFADEGKTVVLNGRKTVEWRRWEQLAVVLTPLVEGVVNASGSNQTVNVVTATPLQYGDYIVHSDILEVVSFDPYLDSQAAVFGDQAGNTLDQICRNVLHAGGNIQYAGGVGARASVAIANVLTTDEITLAVRTLEDAKVPKIPDQFGGSYWAFVSAKTAYAIRQDPAWIRVNEYAGGGDIKSGELGRWMGVRILLNSNSKVFTGLGFGGIDVHSTLVFGAHWYGKASFAAAKDSSTKMGTPGGEMVQFYVKQPGSAGSADPLDQIGSIGWKASHITKILNDSCGLRIEHAVPA